MADMNQFVRGDSLAQVDPSCSFKTDSREVGWCVANRNTSMCVLCVEIVACLHFGAVMWET